MKVFKFYFVCFLISLGSSNLVPGQMRCLSGPNWDAGLEEETPGFLIDCFDENQICLRIDAALYQSDQTNTEDRPVAVGLCVEPNKCDQSQCIGILAMFWSVNFTDGEYGGSGIDSPVHYGEYGGSLSSLFDVRYCDLECCKGDLCNEQNVTYIRSLKHLQTQETTTVRQGAMSIRGVNVFIGMATLISNLLLLQNL